MINPTKIAELLVRLPYVIKPGPIPPFIVIKEILVKGEFDAGMSGGDSWAPIDISQHDYDKIIAELKKIKKGIFAIEAPDGVENYRDWTRWRLIQRAATRGNELSQLFVRRDLLERQRVELVRLNKLEDAETVDLELIKLDGEMSDLLVDVARAR